MKQQGSLGTGLLPSGRGMIYNELSNSTKITSTRVSLVAVENGYDLTRDEDPTDEDGDTGMGDSTGV
ncbi:hypothetical protein Tco_0718602 [Tanacetum coccineum]